MRVFSAGRRPDAAGFDPLEQELLLQHAALGCISLWCTHAQSAYPFVFRTRLVKSAIPCAQLIYCRDMPDFVRFAGPIGRFLALRGRPFVIVDANGPIAGLVGIFRRGTCRNISAVRSARALATSPTPSTRCSASDFPSLPLPRGRAYSTAPCGPLPANAAI